MQRRDFLRHSAQLSAAGAAAVTGLRMSRAEKPRPDRIRVGQIGTAHAHAAGKMETLRKFPDLFEVVGLVEPDAALRERLSAHKVYRDVPLLAEEQLLAAPGLQAVAVETEVRDLVPTARRCAAAGVHIHLDKPAGESLDDLRSLLDEATAHKRIVQMGYMLRYNPGFDFAFKAVKQGWLGD
ncbi:MAG: Gfo/Idh/MocA family protein, partial [Pirellulales bacterium]